MKPYDPAIDNSPEIIFGFAVFGAVMLVYALSIWWTRRLAFRRGRSRRYWTAWAALAGPLALMVLLVLPIRRDWVEPLRDRGRRRRR